MRTCQFRIPPFLMCFPPFAYGKALRAGDTLNTRTLGTVLSLCHLPLGWEKQDSQVAGVLSSGARYSLCRHPVAPVRNFVIGECLYKYPRSNRKKLLLIPYRRGDSRISRKYPQCTFITIPYFECKVSSSNLPLVLALSTMATVTGVSL